MKYLLHPIHFLRCCAKARLIRCDAHLTQLKKQVKVERNRSLYTNDKSYAYAQQHNQHALQISREERDMLVRRLQVLGA